jgi:hypothetical protein
VLEVTADGGESGLQILHHLNRLGSEALHDFAARVNAGLAGQINGAVWPLTSTAWL